jgi:hypothetical protein
VSDPFRADLVDVAVPCGACGEPTWTVFDLGEDWPLPLEVCERCYIECRLGPEPRACPDLRLALVLALLAWAVLLAPPALWILLHHLTS